MKIARGQALAAKQSLTPHEKIKAAFLHYNLGWAQSDIQVALDGVNVGRINEACTAQWAAAGGTVQRYKKRAAAETAATPIPAPKLTKRGTPRITAEERREKAREGALKRYAKAAKKKTGKKASPLPSKKRAARRAKITMREPAPLPMMEEQAS
jgi:hypothetical protein